MTDRLARIRLLPVTIFVAALMLTVRVGYIWDGVDGLIHPTLSVSEAAAQQQPRLFFATFFSHLFVPFSHIALGQHLRGHQRDGLQLPVIQAKRRLQKVAGDQTFPHFHR